MAPVAALWVNVSRDVRWLRFAGLHSVPPIQGRRVLKSPGRVGAVDICRSEVGRNEMKAIHLCGRNVIVGFVAVMSDQVNRRSNRKKQNHSGREGAAIG